MPALLAVSPVAYGTLALAAGLFLVALFWAVRPGGVSLLAWLAPRERALRAARRKLQDGDWQGAFAISGQLRNPARPDPVFERRLLSFEGDCLYRGAERSLQLGRYAEALELMRGAGDRLGLPEEEFDRRIVGLLLAEIRRRITSDPAGHEVARLCNEAIRVAGNLPEASFWLALHHLHKNEEPLAREALHDALADPQSPDPALYLGVLCRRAGQPAEALRWLGRAMGNAPDCLVVQWQFAAAALDAGSDPVGAVKTLEKVTAADGLPKYQKTPSLIWADLGPRSWLAALVRRTPVPCPIGLDRVGESLAEARRILAAGLDKCERSADAAAMYYQSFSAGDESLAVRKGLGLNLARAGLYDDALPHLAAAHKLEQPPTPLTTGYLALATARARAVNPADRANHVREAFGLLTAVQVRDDPEWSKLARELAGEAKDAGVELPTAQKLELAKAFASIEARDPVAIDAYNQLAATDVEIPLEVAFVYIRAATEQDIRGQHDLALFDRAFKDRDAFRKSFLRKKWDADAVERAYLERSVEARPGRYPDAPGPLYAALAERHLLEEHRRLTAQGITARADAALQLATALGPTRALTLDRLAERADRAGDRAECLRILGLWEEKHPHDARPAARRALLKFQEGQVEAALEGLTDACAKAAGPQRARILLVTARVALAAQQPDVAIELFDQARLLAPNDAEPVTGLAALAWQRGDYDRLASLAPLFDKARTGDPFRALLACLAFALAGDEERSEAEFAVVASHPPLAPEASYLRSILLAWQNRAPEARLVLDDAVVSAGPTRDHVHALRGQLAWQGGDFGGALEAWKELSPERRAEWKLDALFPAALFLGGVAALHADNATLAADLFQQARVAGFDHPQLVALEATSKQHAAQTGTSADGPAAVVALHELEEALASRGNVPPNLIAWLARGYRKQGDLTAARRVLDRAVEPTAHVWLQKGLLALAECDLLGAEAAFVAARNRAPDAPAVAFNLAFTHMSLGKLDAIGEELDRAASLHPTVDAKRILAQLAVLAPGAKPSILLAHLSSQDEQRLLRRLQQAGNLETALAFLQSLSVARPNSVMIRQARADANVLWVLAVINRGTPELALGLTPAGAPGKVFSNLLGVAAALAGDLTKALEHFHAALPMAGDDARVQQNLALTADRLGDSTRAREHWQRYLTSMPAHCPAPPGDADYLYRLGEWVRRQLAGEAPTP